MDLYFRSLLFVPGNRPDMLEKALKHPADGLTPDMEDSVRSEDKTAARDTIRRLLPQLAAGGRLVVPRVNSLPTGLTEADLAVVIGPHVPMISIGKFRSVADVQTLDTLLAQAERRAGVPVGTTQVLPWMETAPAILDARSLFAASSRITAAAFGADDFAVDMGVVRGENPLENHYPKAHLAMAARAAGVRLLDSSCIHFRDLAPLARELDEAKMLGFTGKFAIHPAQVALINARFSPDPAALARAQGILAAWAAAPAGRGALNHNGIMVDEPLVRQCRQLVEQAARIAKLEARFREAGSAL